MFPIGRELDGVYYRATRDRTYVNRRLADWTVTEQNGMMTKCDAGQLRWLCRCLSASLRKDRVELDLVTNE